MRLAPATEKMFLILLAGFRRDQFGEKASDENTKPPWATIALTEATQATNMRGAAHRKATIPTDANKWFGVLRSY